MSIIHPNSFRFNPSIAFLCFSKTFWAEVARQAIKQKIEELKMFNQLMAKSKLTEKDALELGKKIKKSMHKKYSKL